MLGHTNYWDYQTAVAIHSNLIKIPEYMVKGLEPDSHLSIYAHDPIFTFSRQKNSLYLINNTKETPLMWDNDIGLMFDKNAAHTQQQNSHHEFMY